MQKKKATE